MPVVTDVSVAKVWDDNNDQDGLRPVVVAVVLLGDGNVVGTATLSDYNGWKASFSDLPVYSNGKLIEYSVQELDVAGYTCVVSGDADYAFTVVNSHVPVVTDVSVAKVWDDNNDQDGLRPVEVSVVLLGDGNVVGTVTLNANNGWKASFSDLPVYSNGKLIKYSVQELEVANYVSVVSSDADYAFTVVNSHVPVVTDVSVAKVWDDNNDQDGLRPVVVAVVLLGDGNVVGTATLSDYNGWKASFSDLPVYSNGKLIEYSVQELDVAGYTCVVSGDADYAFTVVNSHVPVVTDVSVAKVWDDNNDQDGLRPVEVSVVLLGDGNVVGTVTLNANNGWKASFSDLPVYSNGKLIKYSVQELEVANYVSVVSSDAEYDFTVVNTHVPEVTVVNVTKVWKGVDDKDKKPVEVILYADGVKVSNITLYPGNNWKFSFEDLPIYKDGKKINYTIGIDGADNYTVDITEENGNFTITTTVVPEEDENITDETEEIDEVDDSDDETPTPQPSVPHKHHVSKHVKPDKNATGNPIALLLLALFIPLIRRKQN